MENLETLETNFYNYAAQCIQGGYVVNPADKEQISNLFKAFLEGKSIIIFGSNGTGKTMLFELLKRITHPQSKLRFRSRNVLDTVLDFNTRGHEAFRDDTTANVFYDDLGSEDKGYWYGDKVEVFDKLMQFRYDRWRSDNLRTFFTSNLTLDEIKARYGSRFRDRLREQYYQVVLNGESKRSLKNFKGFAPIHHKPIISKEEQEWRDYYNARREAIKNAPKEEKQNTGKFGIGSKLKDEWNKRLGNSI